MSHNEMDLDQFQRLLWGFAGHRVITVAGRTGMTRWTSTSSNVCSGASPATE
jgi:hypothetical protein